MSSTIEKFIGYIAGYKPEQEQSAAQKADAGIKNNRASKSVETARSSDGYESTKPAATTELPESSKAANREYASDNRLGRAVTFGATFGAGNALLAAALGATAGEIVLFAAPFLFMGAALAWPVLKLVDHFTHK